MKTILTIPGKQYDTVIAHLLPRQSSLEEAAFLFVIAVHGDGVVKFDVQAVELLSRNDFEAQETDYLELLDEFVRALSNVLTTLAPAWSKCIPIPDPSPRHFRLLIELDSMKQFHTCGGDFKTPVSRCRCRPRRV